MHHHKYSLTELEEMLPWEREIYIGLLMKYLREEEERIGSKPQGDKDGTKET